MRGKRKVRKEREMDRRGGNAKRGRGVGMGVRHNIAAAVCAESRAPNKGIQKNGSGEGEGERREEGGGRKQERNNNNNNKGWKGGGHAHVKLQSGHHSRLQAFERMM
mmetsp:Transcript_43284/g.112485  ORF Transcript_43284/g.112485 Transcript_43284/m.112485 type:complete len:107 (-) Transcript_43284:609-929(-)